MLGPVRLDAILQHPLDVAEGTVAVVGEVIAQIVTDKRLRARYRHANGLAATISAAALRRTG